MHAAQPHSANAAAAQIAISDLPAIADILHVAGRPYYVILDYREFVGLVAAGGAENLPDDLAVLDREGDHVFAIIRFEAYRAYLSRLTIDGEIDQAHYFSRHDDVRRAVESGAMHSATSHYLRHGYLERREARLPVRTRRLGET